MTRRKKTPSDRPQPPQTLRERAEAMLRASPADIQAMASEDVQRLVHELQVHQMELEIQNEELRQAQAELAHSRDRYADLYEFAPVGYVTLDADSTILEANLTAAEMLRVERRALLGRNLSQYTTRASSDELYQHRQAVFSSDVKQTCEIELLVAEGVRLAARLESVAFEADDQRRCRTALIDVTKRKKAEEAIHRLNEELEQRVADRTAELAMREHEFRALADNVPALFSYVDRHQQYRYVNHSYEELFQRPAEEIVGKAVVDHIGPQRYEIARPHIEAVLGGERVVYQEEFEFDDGPHTMHVQYVPDFSEDGLVQGFFTLINDLTDWKRAEQQVRLLAEAISHLGEGVLITDDELDWPGPRIRFVNDALCRITGYTADELIGQTPRILQSDGTDRATLDRIKAELSAGRSCRAELVNFRKDGTPYHAELFITPLRDADGRRTNFVSIHRDITEQKKAAQQLRDSEERFRALTNATSDVVYCMSPDWTEMRHLEGREFIADTRQPSRAWLETYIHPDDQALVMETIQRAIRAKGVFELEHRVIRVDGTLGWTHSRAIPILDAQGEIVEWFGAATDVTPRKEALVALRDREERLRAILNTAADAIITIDHSGVITDVNAATEKMFGYAEHELVGRNVKMLMPSPYADQHDGYIRSYLETGKARIIGIGREAVGRRQDGSTFPVGLAINKVHHLQLFTGVVRDISVVKELQKQVLETAAAEARRIGHELHDNLQQQLTGLGLLAQSLAESLAAESAPQAKIAARLADGIRQSAHDVHLLSRGLVPVEVDAEGLRAALSELAARIRDQYGIDCRFHRRGSIGLTDNFAATHLYRVAQEAVTNAVKHGQAGRIEIILAGGDETITLKVLDNGVGIGDKREPGPGMGLRIMQYRAGLIGATLFIGPAEGCGTQVSCTVLRGRGNFR